MLLAWSKSVKAATTTPEAEVFYPAVVQAAETSSIDSCALWWLFALAWLVISAIAYWIGGQGRFAIVAPIIQLVFWIAALALLIASLMFDIPCAWWPAVIVGIGAPVVYFLSGRPKDEVAML